jgi:hypothetical protein
VTVAVLVAKKLPANLQALFELLGQGGWIEAEQAPSIQRMAGFRNLPVYGYGRIDLLVGGRPHQGTPSRSQGLRRRATRRR